MSRKYENIDLNEFKNYIEANSSDFRRVKISYHTNEYGQTDVKVEDINDGVFIRTTSAHLVEVRQPVEVVVETPEPLDDVIVDVMLNKDVIDVIRMPLASKKGDTWRSATFTFTPDRPGVYTFKTDRGEPHVIRVYRMHTRGE